jgi:hypothetical protein
MTICKEITDSTCEHAQRSKGEGLRVAGAYAVREAVTVSSRFWGRDRSARIASRLCR